VPTLEVGMLTRVRPAPGANTRCRPTTPENPTNENRFTTNRLGFRAPQFSRSPLSALRPDPQQNDLGDVVFTAGLDDFTNGGVFTGDNPRTDKVLRTGDTYEGVLVTSLFTCSEALNNLGQIVMTVQSQDPDTFEVRTFIVKATPRNLRND
jgi:hypothetical protein